MATSQAHIISPTHLATLQQKDRVAERIYSLLNYDNLKVVVAFMEKDAKLIQDESGELYYIKEPTQFSRMLWDPEPLEKVIGIHEIGRITTYHYGDYVFSPKRIKVIAQLPEKYYHPITAFRILPSTATIVNVLSDKSEEPLYTVNENNLDQVFDLPNADLNEEKNKVYAVETILYGIDY